MEKTIGDRIREKRIEKDITLEKLGELAGVSKVTIHKYENNMITNIPSDRIERIAKGLNVSPAYLMGWDEPPEEPEILEKFPDDIVILARGAKTLTKDQIDLVKNLIDNMNKQNED